MAPTTLNPGDADVEFEQEDVLPAIQLVVEPLDWLTFRASYSETVARQVRAAAGDTDSGRWLLDVGGPYAFAISLFGLARAGARDIKASSTGLSTALRCEPS